MGDKEQAPPDPLKVTGWSSFPTSASPKLGCNHPNHRILLHSSDIKTPALQPPAQANVYGLELSQLQTFSVQPKTFERGEHREKLPTGVHPLH